MKTLNQIFESTINENARDIFPTQKQVEQYLIKFYPKEKEHKLFHDHYGLYSAIPNEPVKKILLCTTPTTEIVKQFDNENYDLLISHHDFLMGIPQIIFHSIMDEETTYGHNIYFAKRMGLKDIEFKSVILSGKLYKPLTIDELLKYLEKHGFKVDGIVHKNSIVNSKDDLLSSIVFCSGHGGMLINDKALISMKWVNDPNFDLRNVEKDVYITGELLKRKDLDNNKFKYIIELGHTNSEKPLFKWMKNRLLNKWPKLQIDLANNDIDFFGKDQLSGRKINKENK
jgi:putative NIF3 family GTP cyclohydrolase 1 type 2